LVSGKRERIRSRGRNMPTVPPGLTAAEWRVGGGVVLAELIDDVDVSLIVSKELLEACVQSQSFPLRMGKRGGGERDRE
jgi:hypothetical protein